MNFTKYICLFVGACATFYVAVHGQSMDPRVSIRATEPPSIGHRIRAEISADVTIDCYVENLPVGLLVNWQRSLFDKEGRETTQLIAQDMAVEDNMKWSIEKPTTYTWRLRIKAAQISDEGNYTCFVRLTGNNNRAEANRTVLIRDRPRILEAFSTTDVAVQEGDYVPMRCNASGRPLPTMMWRREGNSLLPGGGVRRMGAFFDINNVQHTARGLYICESFNEIGYDRRDIYLDVTFPPKISPDPPEVGQKVGYSRTLKCAVEANPIPSIDPSHNQLSWSRDNSAIIPGGRHYMQAIIGAYGMLSLELTINNIAKEDYGTYRCMASTVQGSTVGQVQLIETDDVQPDKRGYASTGRHLVASGITIIVAMLMSSL